MSPYSAVSTSSPGREIERVFGITCEADAGTPWRQRRRLSKGVPTVASTVLVVTLLAIIVVAFELPGTPFSPDIYGPRAPADDRRASIPVGTNFGGWFVLEDWFFSGGFGKNVGTYRPSPGQGWCLPPLLLGVEEPWGSEGLLGKRLNSTMGPKHAAEVFAAHRETYISHSDMRIVKELGMSAVRVPIPWQAFADALAVVDQAAYGSHDPNNDTVMVPDPYYSSQAAFATVPRIMLTDLLEAASEVGLGVLLDVHTMPGGSSDGTYNGIWPLRPAFWEESVTVGGNATPLKECGMLIVKALVEWAENVDARYRSALHGITIMNEPAHLRTSYGPPTFASSERDVLDWLAAGADVFRQSALPGRGVKLYVNLIESAFYSFWRTTVPWFEETFTYEERLKWAVFDVHWYSAWSPHCKGVITGGEGYRCSDDMGSLRRTMRHCARDSYAATFQSRYPTGLRANTEFSVGTNEYVLEACSDVDVTGAFMQEQLRAFNDFGIESFFWTWRMPYGRNFESGWSLKRLARREVPRPPNPCGPEYSNVTGVVV